METKNLEGLFAELFGSEEEQEEASQYSFTSESDIDDNIEAVQNIEVNITRFKTLYKEKSDKLKSELDSKLDKLNRQKEWILLNLKNSVIAAGDSIETKTQYKKEYLSGSIVIKKSKVNILKPELTPEIIERDYADYKKEDTKITLDWKALKGDLKILNDVVLNTKTGEVLSDILTETVAEQVIVK